MSLITDPLHVVLVMNTMNFIDGLDGLVAGVALIANGVFFLYSYMLVAADVARPNYFNLASLIAADPRRRLRRLPAAQLAPGEAVHGRRGRPAGRPADGDLAPSPSPARSTRSSLAATAQLLPAFMPLLLPFAILIVPLLDFGLAVVRRLARRQVPVQRRPEAPAPPPARHGPLAACTRR